MPLILHQKVCFRTANIKGGITILRSCHHEPEFLTLSNFFSFRDQKGADSFNSELWQNVQRLLLLSFNTSSSSWEVVSTNSRFHQWGSVSLWVATLVADIACYVFIAEETFSTGLKQPSFFLVTPEAIPSFEKRQLVIVHPRLLRT